MYDNNVSNNLGNSDSKPTTVYLIIVTMKAISQVMALINTYIYYISAN